MEKTVFKTIAVTNRNTETQLCCRAEGSRTEVEGIFKNVSVTRKWLWGRRGGDQTAAGLPHCTWGARATGQQKPLLQFGSEAPPGRWKPGQGSVVFSRRIVREMDGNYDPGGECVCAVAQPCPAVCSSRDCSTPWFPVLHHLLEFAHIHVHRVGDTILTVSSSAVCFSFCLQSFQHQGLCQWISLLNQLAKVLELQHQSFQWIFRVDFL